jgi:predicted Ser/Thr protein kinase
MALASLLEAYMAEISAGRAPDRERLLAENPGLAAQLDACLAGIDFIHKATGAPAEEPAVLGDFRIVRELGRGGMGVVYEAEQTSLGRRVALKVLRYGVVADPEAMQRFRREAETVARLHHTNIVPIFAIGCQRDVHYYAMQYIDGRSLAEVLAQAQGQGKQLTYEHVVAWALQAAEALAHAHQRGVIHRDIKPANLLLDAEGVVWLTDFGLAKRADEATLTVIGALLGTPRYMSPEQAESLARPVDHRSDLYSLGASLYELATGRPVFEAATPHGIIRQIVSEEPARPRTIRPSLPRDLETIILKCLSKDPKERYQSAHALAQDLRAVLEGRPIQARRAFMIERTVRYVRKHRKVLAGAAIAAAATALLLVAGFAGSRAYSAWRLGHIVLSSDGPPLRALVIAESGDQPAGEEFDIGARTIVSLPSGDYRLRVQGKGLVGQTYRVALNRGETRTHRLVLDDNRLLGNETIPYAIATEAVELTARKAEFIEWTGESLIRRDGATGKVIWDAARPARRWEPDRDPVAWMRRLCRFGDQKRPGVLTQPAPDLNGDGVGDLIWGMKGTSSLLALSGKDGSLLWAYTVDLSDAARSAPTGRGVHAGRILATPSVTDIDGDGTADVMAAFALYDESRCSDNTPEVPPGRTRLDMLGEADKCVVAAVSGRSGQSLWRQDLGAEGMPLQRANSDGGATILRGRQGALLGVGSSRWVGLDLATGRPRAPAIDLGFVPMRPLQYADLDGDGGAEVLALGTSDHPSFLTLSAFSATTGNLLAVEKVSDAYYLPERRDWPRGWPLVVDLDSDGRAEIVIPDFLADPGSSGVRLVDGADGQTRWLHSMRPYTGGHDGLLHLLAGPDLDGDGTSDIVAVSRYDGPTLERLAGAPEPKCHVYVDALSGKDGHGLWWWRTEITNPDGTRIGVPFWWGRGADGWPMLGLGLGGDPMPGTPRTSRLYSSDPPVVHLLEGGTGKEAHTVVGLSFPKTADLDGDGLADLWGSVEGTLRAFRGEAPEAWRVLGQLQVAGDLDGDGFSDVISGDLATPEEAQRRERAESRTVVARSGRDGRPIWCTALDPWDGWYSLGEWTRGYTLDTFARGRGDLDGDGTPDVLVRRDAVALGPGPPARLALQALSGQTGRQLWSAGPLPPLESRTFGYCYIEGVDVCPSHGRDQPDVLAFYDTPFNQSVSGLYQQTRLARLSGQDGRVVWDVLIAEHKKGQYRLMWFVHEFGDLDGAGGPEIVLRLHGTSAAATSGFELRALSLADGSTLWGAPVGAPGAGQPAFRLGDLDGDGRAEAVIRSLPPDGVEGAVELAALDGRDGSVRWKWRGGDRRQPANQAAPFCLADFEGEGRRAVCVAFCISDSLARVVILDGQGRVHAESTFPASKLPTLNCADLDGDGRDELLLHDDAQLRALRRDLKELWARSDGAPVREVWAGHKGSAATVVLGSGVGLDGATGRPMWSGRAERGLIPATSGSELPRALSGPEGTTVCRMVMPLSAREALEPPRGAPAHSVVVRDDPRWQRPLPWVDPVAPPAHPLFQLAVLGALINIAAPLLILWLATRRRFWSVRLLLALPAMVAIPLAGVPALGSLFPNRSDGSAWQAARGIALISLAGLPLLAYALTLGSTLVGWRWRRLVCLLVLTVLAAVVIGEFWLSSDNNRIPSREHYVYDGLYHIIWWGAYAVGVLGLLARPARAAGRLAWRGVRYLLRPPIRVIAEICRVWPGPGFGRMGRT